MTTIDVIQNVIIGVLLIYVFIANHIRMQDMRAQQQRNHKQDGINAEYGRALSEITGFFKSLGGRK